MSFRRWNGPSYSFLELCDPISKALVEYGEEEVLAEAIVLLGESLVGGRAYMLEALIRQVWR